MEKKWILQSVSEKKSEKKAGLKIDNVFNKSKKFRFVFLIFYCKSTSKFFPHIFASTLDLRWLTLERRDGFATRLLSFAILKISKNSD